MSRIYKLLTKEINKILKKQKGVPEKVLCLNCYETIDKCRCYDKKLNKKTPCNCCRLYMG
jgi:hypothetical protein